MKSISIAFMWNTLFMQCFRIPEMAVCRKWRPLFVVLAVYFAMAVMNVLFKEVLNRGETHLVIVTYRLMASAIFLAPIAYYHERKGGNKLTTSILFHLFFSALVGATLMQYLYLLGLQYTSAEFACGFANISPVFTFLMATLFRLEKLNMKTRSGKAKLLGSLICVVGVILLTVYRGIPLNEVPWLHKSHTVITGNGTSTKKRLIGSGFLVMSMVLWSSWFLVQARIGKKFPCKYTSTALMSLFGAAQSGVLCFAIDRDVAIWVLNGKLEIVTVLFAGIVGSGLCYVGMCWCVEQKGPVFTVAFSPFIQIIVAIFDFTFFHEQIYLGSVLGSVLVILGLYILLWAKNREAEKATLKPVECNASTTAESKVVGVTTNSGCP